MGGGGKGGGAVQENAFHPLHFCRCAVHLSGKLAPGSVSAGAVEPARSVFSSLLFLPRGGHVLLDRGMSKIVYNVKENVAFLQEKENTHVHDDKKRGSRNAF